jgi:hypothetical protein
LTRNLLTCSFQILSLAFGDLRMTIIEFSHSLTVHPGQRDGSSVHIENVDG